MQLSTCFQLYPSLSLCVQQFDPEQVATWLQLPIVTTWGLAFIQLVCLVPGDAFLTGTSPSVQGSPHPLFPTSSDVGSVGFRNVVAVAVGAPFSIPICFRLLLASPTVAGGPLSAIRCKQFHLPDL